MVEINNSEITFKTIKEIISEKREKNIRPLIATTNEVYRRNRLKGIGRKETADWLNMLWKTNRIKYGHTLNDIYIFINTNNK